MINLRGLPVEPVADLLRHAMIGRLPSEWEHIQHRVFTAMVRYHVADAIIQQFDPRPFCFPTQFTPRPRIGNAGSPSGWFVADKACCRGTELDASTRADARGLSMPSRSTKTIAHYSLRTKYTIRP